MSVSGEDRSAKLSALRKQPYSYFQLNLYISHVI